MKYSIALSLRLFVLFVIVGIWIYYLLYTKRTIHSPLEIRISEAKGRRFGLVLDVRTPEQRSSLGYYPNSVPISLEKLHTEVPLDISNKKTWILVYSNGDEKAQLAAEQLFQQGYPNVRYIRGSYLQLMPGSQ